MWKEFFEGLARLKESGKPFVIATVVKVSGSTYRRPGARALIAKDGVSTGLISGGCFESDLIERAKRVMETRQPVLVTFDTTSPDDLVFGQARSLPDQRRGPTRVLKHRQLSRYRSCDTSGINLSAVGRRWSKRHSS